MADPPFSILSQYPKNHRKFLCLSSEQSKLGKIKRLQPGIFDRLIQLYQNFDHNKSCSSFDDGNEDDLTQLEGDLDMGDVTCDLSDDSDECSI